MGALVTERTHDGKVLHLRLDSPPGNVLDRSLLGALDAALSEAAEDTRLRAVVLGHTGKHFSYGASVPEHLPGEVETMIPAFHRVCRRLVDLPVPLLAAVGGRCLGGGLELVLPATRIFAAPNAVLGQPEIDAGGLRPGGLPAAAREGGAGARRGPAAIRADRRGPGGAGLGAGGRGDRGARGGGGGLRRGAPLLDKSAFALRVGPRGRADRCSAPDSPRRSRRVERLYLDTLMSGEDPVEGLNAFIGKRQPNWSDR